MGNFVIQVEGVPSEVNRNTPVETSCSNTYSYDINATNGDDIDITLTGDHKGEYYIINGTNIPFTNSVTGIIFDTSLSLHFYLENSGSSGVFDSTSVSIINNTSIAPDYTIVEERLDDSAKCPSSSSTGYREVNSNENLLEDDNVIEATSSSITLTLPTAVGIEAKQYTIKNTSNGNINLDTNGSETIDGVLIATIIPDQSLTVISNGTNWIII